MYVMNLFSNAFMKAPKAKGEAFQRSDVVPKETTQLKTNEFIVVLLAKRGC